MPFGRARIQVLVVPIVAVLAGCGADGGAATQAAEAFARATTANDGAAACELLSPAVADAVAQDAGSCSSGVLQEGLPQSAPLVRAEVFGHHAIVVTATDTVFLSDFPQGWKVIAAGCTPQGEKPYACLVSGGG